MQSDRSKWKALGRPWEFDLLVLVTIIGFIMYTMSLERRYAPEPISPPIVTADDAIPDVAVEPPFRTVSELDTSTASDPPPPTVDKHGRKIYRPKAVEDRSADKPYILPTEREKRETNPDKIFEFDYGKELAQRSWLIILVVSVVLHVILGRTSKFFISTPLWMIIAPAIFAVLGYLYLQQASSWIKNAPAATEGAWKNATVLALIFLGIGFLLARVRLQRIALALREEPWLAEVDAAPSADFGKCLLRLHPLFYPPKRFKISENGILVVGWHFAALLPYDQIKGVTRRKKGNLDGSGFYLTRSFSSLIEVQLRFEHDPVILGPDKHEYFLEKARFLNDTHTN